MNDWIDVGSVNEVGPGQFKTVWVDDVEIALIDCEGQVHAIEDVCTHDGGELTGGLIEGCQIECPRHGARFDIRTGQALTPPAYEPVPVWRVKIDAGRILIAPPEPKPLHT